MQDIAGGRILVPDVIAQDDAILKLQQEFPEAKISDRRLNPSNHYRAVHMILEIFGKSVEIQVRTRLQHLWAEYSEKCADVVDPALKYGRGDPNLLELLAETSDTIKSQEELARLIEDQNQIVIAKMEELERDLLKKTGEDIKDDLREQIEGLRRKHEGNVRKAREDAQALTDRLSKVLLGFTGNLQRVAKHP